MRFLTQSSAAAFRSCHKKAYLRYELGWSPRVQPAPMRFGNLVHDGLQAYHLGQDPNPIIKLKAQTQEDRIAAMAMLKGYHTKYGDETGTDGFDVLALEKEFSLPLFDDDGNEIAGWKRAGKLDGVVRKRSDGKLWLLEHKTASKIDSSYLARLWIDFQITYYSDVGIAVFGEPINGVIYNVLQKPSKADMTLFVGETDAEWQARYDQAKNKKLLKRKLSDTMDDFQARMNKHFSNPANYHREEIFLTEADKALVSREAYETSVDWQSAVERGENAFYRNTNSCYGKFNSACSYIQACQNGYNPAVMDAHYEKIKAHSELEALPEDVVE